MENRKKECYNTQRNKKERKVEQYGEGQIKWEE